MNETTDPKSAFASAPRTQQTQPSSVPSTASPGAGLPSISLPKGGGAIRGIGEKFAANPVTGTGSMSVPIATSPGRSGFGPQLALSYDSGSGNGPFGFGWSLALPSITRKTDKGLPQYNDAHESDVFILSGAEDLVPVLIQNAEGDWERESVPPRTVNGVEYRISRYRPRIEGLFARIERWTNDADATDVFWRSISKDNITTWYGKTSDSRISDPADASHIFSWLICQSYDDKGNVTVYGYKPEDSARIFEDFAGDPLIKAHERNRTTESRSAQRYLKCIRYGNRSPFLPSMKDDAPWPEPQDAGAPDGTDAWLFEVVLDYGEYDANRPEPSDTGVWPARRDPFSSYRAGFEVRTYRACQRVLMFHHFPGEPGIERNCLVRSTDFNYSDEVDPGDTHNPVYTFLRQVIQTGYRRNDGGYDSRSLPPVEFEYSEPIVQDVVEQVDPTSVENLPIGLDGRAYRFTDLHGEGLSGLLTEQADGWFYKRNLSPVPTLLPDGTERVQARFASLETVALKPNVALGKGAEFMDLAGDGQPDVVVMEDPTPGLYEHDDAEAWQPFRPFSSRLNRDPHDPNLKLVDLDGDGHIDALITEDDAFVWHESLAEMGFGEARRSTQSLDEEKGPRVVFGDTTQSIYLADLSGDGLSDIARIRNGEVCYWPNLGYGRFGAKVIMDNAPWFDTSDQFDQKRIRLADIDGSGTADIIYLHRDGVRVYFNQSGNGWSKPRELEAFQRFDDVANIVPVDLLGNGTACLVWSSQLPEDARQPMRYVNLIGDQKPHLLVTSKNNLGAETHVDYAPSTKFYLQDKFDGTPWITRLPFPVHVVERVTTYDQISRNRFVTRYAYHHGYFDGDEREFRGFGMVEQWDTEEFAVVAVGHLPAENSSAESHVPPVHTKTWFHTGFYIGGDAAWRQFEGEYFREIGLSLETARPLLLDNTVLPASLSPDEEREACRALKGTMLRQEVYADDVGEAATPHQVERAKVPYTVTEQNFDVRALQTRGPNRHAVFFTHARESLNYHYERNPADPRIQHALTMEVDAYGNVLKQAAVGYGRREFIRTVDAQGQVGQVANPGLAELDAAGQTEQTTPLLTYTENQVTHAVQTADAYRAPLPCEALTLELTGYTPTGQAGRLQASDLVEPDPGAPNRLRHKFTDQVPYEGSATGKRCRRPVEWLRTLYRSDDLIGLLPLGQLQPLALSGESYKLAFTSGLLTHVFQRPRADQLPEDLVSDPATVLGGQAGDRGGYLRSRELKTDGLFPATDADDDWWVPSGQSFFSTGPADAAATELAQARRHFFLPRRYRDPFNNDALVDFDANDLLMTETRDAVGNRVTVNSNDYRVLQPQLVSDPNGNRTGVAFDSLSMVVGTALMGKSDSATVEGDTLHDFVVDLTRAQLDAFLDTADPHTEAANLLRDATTRVVYDLDRFLRTTRAHPDDSTQWLPACAAILARETHASDPLPPQGSRIQLNFTYSDGFGREIQRKIQAEPGQLVEGGPQVDPRWVGSGWTIFNNKGKPFRQYEPFFSKRQQPDGTSYSDHRFEFGVTIGVGPVLFYDPVERVVATLHPNYTYEKVVYTPWQQTKWDVNDTCAARNLETGESRSDPDIGGYVAEYFNTQQATPSWYAQRISGALGIDEQRAAERAAAHADTPTTEHFDPLGRSFLTVARNRVVCAGHDLDDTEESLDTRVELDIEGNQRELRDERGLPVNNLPSGALEQRVVMRYSYDLIGNRILRESQEAGARWILKDVTGKPIRAWDSRGHNFTMKYDALRRPIEETVRGTFSDADPLKPNSDPRTLNSDILVDKIEYGEGVANAEDLNLRARIYRHFDSAGIATNAGLDPAGNPLEAYDFKGNLLRSTRQLVSDYTLVANWLSNPQLAAESFESSTRYDALNRPVQSVAPHSNQTAPGHPNRFNVTQAVFNEANLLERIDVWLERATEPATLLAAALDAPSPVGVADIDYNAKGQRLRIDYENGVSTFYSYDALTFRLTRLICRRNSAAFPDDDPQPPVADWPGKQTQNLTYTYDPVGNITHIRDDAQQAIYFRNQRVEPSNDYLYDALYRLIQAVGREHLGQLANGDRMPPGAPDGFDAFHTRLDHPADGGAMGTYTERYVYDAVGNFLQMQHGGSDPANPGWTRAYDYLEPSLVEPGKHSNRLSRTLLNPTGNPPLPATYLYDAHGSMVRMPHLGGGQQGPNMHWNYRDLLGQTDLGGGGIAYYSYDATGQRVRKVWEKSPGLTEERIYFGGFEIFRKHGGAIGPNSATLERESVHVMDDKQRIALVETRTLGSEPGMPPRLIRYQVGNHLKSSSLELDEQAQIISYEEFAPYGSSTYQAVRSQTETPKRYRYTAKECDEENGLYYNGMRYYAAWLGRWIACDPVGTVDGTSLFVYVGDNPTNRTDPTGRQWTPWQERMRMQQLAEAVRPVGEAVEGAVDWTGQVTTGVGRAGLDFTIGTFKLVTGLLGASWGEETVSETVEGVRNLPTTVKETVDNWDQLSAEEKAYRLTTGALLVRGAYKFAKGMTSGRPGGEPVTERPPTVEEGASPSRPPTPRAEAKPAETSAKPAETSAPTPRQGLEETGPARFRVAIIDRLHTTLARQILRLGEGIRNRDIPYLRNLGLRSATIRQLLQGRGKGFAAAYGRALERALTRAIQSDPELGKYFEHIGSRAGVAVRPPGRPDFRGRPGTEFEGWLVDLTTTAGREAHHGRYYGEKMLVLPYDRPGSR